MNSVTRVEDLPRILQLNAGGEPVNWIDYEKSAYFYAKDRVLWDLGHHEVILRGGTNAMTGLRSRLEMATIIAVKCNHSPRKFRSGVPSLTNKALFTRDQHICGYCGDNFSKHELTRDHVNPRSRGGEDSWTNLVTACKSCNHKKAARTPAEANMPLIYVPFVPNYNEHLILQNKRILFDQMEYLKKGIAEDSRIHELIASDYFTFQ